MVDELDGDDIDLGAVVAAAGTPPFLTERRVVVVRGIDRFSSDELRVLTGYVLHPLDTHRAGAEHVRGAAEAPARRPQAGRRRPSATPTRRARRASDAPGSTSSWR